MQSSPRQHTSGRANDASSHQRRRRQRARLQSTRAVCTRTGVRENPRPFWAAAAPSTASIESHRGTQASVRERSLRPVKGGGGFERGSNRVVRRHAIRCADGASSRQAVTATSADSVESRSGTRAGVQVTPPTVKVGGVDQGGSTRVRTDMRAAVHMKPPPVKGGGGDERGVNRPVWFARERVCERSLWPFWAAAATSAAPIESHPGTQAGVREEPPAHKGGGGAQRGSNRVVQRHTMRADGASGSRAATRLYLRSSFPH